MNLSEVLAGLLKCNIFLKSLFYKCNKSTETCNAKLSHYMPTFLNIIRRSEVYLSLDYNFESTQKILRVFEAF